LEVRGSIAQMTVTFSERQAVVSVVGELDLVDRELFTSLMAQVRARHPQRIVLDLAELEFLSLPLLHELERDGTGAELVVANAYGIVKRLLELVGSIGSQN
jgi:anti-anti-sigma factor